MTPFNSKLSSHKPLSKQLAPFIHLGQDLCTINMRCADCSTFFQFYNAFILKKRKKNFKPRAERWFIPCSCSNRNSRKSWYSFKKQRTISPRRPREFVRGTLAGVEMFMVSVGFHDPGGIRCRRRPFLSYGPQQQRQPPGTPGSVFYYLRAQRPEKKTRRDPRLISDLHLRVWPRGTPEEDEWKSSRIGP